jgi:hypothetical protein
MPLSSLLVLDYSPLFGGGVVRDTIVFPSFEDWLIIDIGPRTNTQVIVGQADLNGYNDVHTS